MLHKNDLSSSFHLRVVSIPALDKLYFKIDKIWHLKVLYTGFMFPSFSFFKNFLPKISFSLFSIYSSLLLPSFPKKYKAQFTKSSGEEIKLYFLQNHPMCIWNSHSQFTELVINFILFILGVSLKVIQVF